MPTVHLLSTLIALDLTLVSGSVVQPTLTYTQSCYLLVNAMGKTGWPALILVLTFVSGYGSPA